MKDVVTIAPLAGDPGLIGTSARTVDISRAYWSRRTGVKAAELLRPASQNSPSSRNSFRSGALVPCAGSEQTRTVPSPPPGRVPSRCSAVRAAHQPPPDDSSIAHLRRLAECGARVSAATDAVTKARFEQGGAGMACACTRAEQVER